MLGGAAQMRSGHPVGRRPSEVMMAARHSYSSLALIALRCVIGVGGGCWSEGGRVGWVGML